MAPDEPRKIQFINLSHPIDVASAESQRRANSHAARIAHARTRRLRTIEYQARKAMQHPVDDWRVDEETRTTNELEKGPVPSPVSLLASDRRDPFTSFASAFKPIEHFLLDHYVRAVIPYLNINCNKLRDSVSYLERMAKEWVRLALSDLGFLNGIFLAACRHLSENHRQQQFFKQLAIQYKLACVQALNNAISVETSSVSDPTVAKVLVLAWDEIWLGDFAMSWRHVQGAIKMVEINGGPQTLGLNGFLENLFHKFVSDVGLLVAS